MFAATFQILFLLAPVFGGYVFPDDFQICRRDDENLNACMLSAMRDAWPKLADPGISSPITIKTEPVLSPYCEYHINIDELHFDEYLFNVSFTGFINSVIKSASINLENLTLNFTTFTPHVVEKAQYHANGTVFYDGTQNPDPIWGFGLLVSELYNVTILHQIKSEIVIKDGEEYLEVISYNVSVGMDFLTFDYQNLYNGTDPEMAERAGSYVNATAAHIVASQQQVVEDFLGGMFESYAEAIIGSIPFSEILP